MIDCSQFYMPLPVWFLWPERPTTTLHCSGTSTGCVSLSVSSSSYVCWRTGIFKARHRRTSQTTYSARLLMATDVTSGLLTLQLWWLDLPDARRSATVRVPWHLHVLRTVSHQPSGMRHHFCRSGAAWRHGFLNWHCNTDFTGCTSFRFDTNSIKCPCNVSMTVSL